MLDRATRDVSCHSALPTPAEIAGAKPTDEATNRVEGRSLVPLLRNPKTEWADRTLFTHIGRWPKGAKVDDHKTARGSATRS